MTGSGRRSARPRHPALSAAVCLLLAAGLGGPAALGQDQTATTAADAIFARKTMMDALSSKMDAIETATSSTKKIDLPAANEQADIISVLLMAFPHMFPAATNQWKPNVDKDPGTDTFAAPEVWTNMPISTSRRPRPRSSPTLRAAPPRSGSSGLPSPNCALPATAATRPI